MILKHNFKIKPLSANKMYYRSKRSKTREYLDYQMELRDELIGTTSVWPFGAEPVAFTIEAGMSSKLADLDNIMKPLFDTYQSIYGDFNDKAVYEIKANKLLVPRGDEFLNVEVRQFPLGEEKDSQAEEGGEESSS